MTGSLNKNFPLLIILLFLSACNFGPDAQSVIDKAIAVHGGENYDNASIQFSFRDRHYTVIRADGKYKYSRMYNDSSRVILDEMDNNSFERRVNGELVEVLEKDQARYSSSINSVIYFALLPYALNDPAVIKKYLGETIVDGEPYYEVQVTFKQEGGGEDFEDVFVYWIHQKKYTLDYLAYEFHVDGGGTRFRKAVNGREVNGIRFADYINYEGVSKEIPLQQYDELYQEGKLEKLSEINLKNIKVRQLGDEVRFAKSVDSD